MYFLIACNDDPLRSFNVLIAAFTISAVGGWFGFTDGFLAPAAFGAFDAFGAFAFLAAAGDAATAATGASPGATAAESAIFTWIKFLHWTSQKTNELELYSNTFAQRTSNHTVHDTSTVLSEATRFKTAEMSHAFMWKWFVPTI